MRRMTIRRTALALATVLGAALVTTATAPPASAAPLAGVAQIVVGTAHTCARVTGFASKGNSVRFSRSNGICRAAVVTEITSDEIQMSKRHSSLT